MVSKIEVTAAVDMHYETLRLASVFRVLACGHDLHGALRTLLGEGSPTAFAPALELLENKKRLLHAVDQLYLAVVRTAVTESFELTREYRQQTNQTERLKAQRWFTVFRLIRNAFDHNFLFEFRRNDLKQLPVTWNSVTIDAGMDGAELTHAILPPDVAIDWLDEIHEFIRNGLR